VEMATASSPKRVARSRGILGSNKAMPEYRRNTVFGKGLCCRFAAG